MGKARGLKRVLERANVPIGEVIEGHDQDQTWDGMSIDHDAIIAGTAQLPIKADTDVSDYMVDEVLNSDPEELTIIMLGTLTNLATTMERYPGGAEAFQQKVKKIYVIAGGIYVINCPPSSEWNICRDKRAADYVFRKAIESPSGNPKIIVIPLDTTMDFILPTSNVTGIIEPASTTVTNYTTPILRWWLNLDNPVFVCNPLDPEDWVNCARVFNGIVGGFYPYDTIGVAIALNSSLIATEELHKLGVNYLITGHTDIRDDLNDRERVKIIYDFDTDTFHSKALELLTKQDNPKPSGETITVCKSGGCDYNKIKDAINAADYGETVEVTDYGTYYEDIDIYGSGITLDCGGAILTTLSSGYSCIRIFGSNNTIKNCEIKDCRRGIAVIGIGPALEDHTSGNKIISNEIHDTTTVISGDGYGIEIAYSDSIVIEGNDIKNNANDGIYAQYVEFSNIEDNTIESNDGMGILLSNSKYENTIKDNSIKNNSDNGIRLYQSDYDVIGYNFIEYNKNNGIYTRVSDHVKINNNNIKQNSKNGVDIGGYYNIILDNLIIGNEKAIITSSYGDKIMENEIWLNDYGIYIDVFHFSSDPVSEISYNDLCYYGTSSTNTDIYVYDSDSTVGDENTCSTTYNFDDNGTSGCTYSCSGCVCNSGLCCDGCHYYPISTICGINKECDADGNCIPKPKNTNIYIKEGWNLFSTPLDLIDKSVSSVFNGINADVYGYKNNAWFTPTEIENKLGYWLNSDQSKNLTLTGTEIENKTIQISNGWNLIGYPYLGEKNITELFENYPVYLYNNTWSSYIPNRTTNSLATLQPGFGYWIKK